MNLDEVNPDIDVALDALLQEAIAINNEINISNEHFEETLAHVETRVGAAENELNDMFTELDTAEKEAEEDIDALILTEIEEIEGDEA